MPAFDGTGPWGLGPLTGRGYGRGYGRWFGYGRGYGYYPFPPSKEEEKEMLENGSRILQERLEAIKKRLAELDKEEK